MADSGYDLSEVDGHAVVLHDNEGNRIGCGVLAPPPPELRATIEVYPGYTGDFNETSGSVTVTSSAALTLQYDLSGKDSAGGMHIHAGTTCAESGGHYWTPANATDAWIPAVTSGDTV